MKTRNLNKILNLKNVNKTQIKNFLLITGKESEHVWCDRDNYRFEKFENNETLCKIMFLRIINSLLVVNDFLGRQIKAVPRI